MQLFYTVRPGDTVFLIAKRWELPVDTLVAANNLTHPYIIHPGQQLSIPPGVNRVRVRPQESVFLLSQQYGVPPEVIIKANNLKPPYIIQPGQLLTIPPGVPYYVIQPGDTLFTIALRYNVVTRGHSNPELIRQVNRLPSFTILPGMKLVIPYAPPGEGGLIAYTSNQGGVFDIWLYDPLDGVKFPLTQGLGDSFSVPYWSPDGKKIAFIGKNSIIHVIDVISGFIANIDQAEPFTYLSWSPDSRQLAYTKPKRIILYDTAVHAAKMLNQPTASDVQWFPGGQELLFAANDSAGISQLFRIRTDGTGKRQITRNTDGPLHNVRLAPDGMSALYTTPGVSISLIYTVNIATGTTKQIPGGPLAKNYNPEWSPDSQRIAYNATAFEDRGYFSLIRTSKPGGEDDRTRAISNCFSSPVSWSSDGQKLLFLSGCNQQEMAKEIWSIDLRYPVPIQLVKDAQITTVRWSPTTAVLFPQTVYSSPVFHVQLSYPAHWQKVNDERYEGTNGFFQIGAISSGDSMEQVCQSEAFHKLRPYGSAPHIFKTRILGQEACFIYPSADQPPEMHNQAALIVRYPKPVQILGVTYNYLILWADQPHLQRLVEGLRFLSERFSKGGQKVVKR